MGACIDCGDGPILEHSPDPCKKCGENPCTGGEECRKPDGDYYDDTEVIGPGGKYEVYIAPPRNYGDEWKDKDIAQGQPCVITGVKVLGIDCNY